MSSPFDAVTRQALLVEYFELNGRLTELTEAIDSSESGDSLAEELSHVQERLWELSQEYAQGVPVIPISRCPFTGREVVHSIDHFGLDGLWWDSESPVRPGESLPPAFFALTGAVKLGSGIEEFPFLCQPGPGAPFVIPRLIEHPDIKAVVSSLAVGRHQAYPVFYFADPVPYDVDRVNTWGTEDYVYLDPGGHYRWDSGTLSPADLDFDLEKWIRAGKLLWIAPGDARLTLRSDTRRCPYLSADGRRGLTYVRQGRTWAWDANQPD